MGNYHVKVEVVFRMSRNIEADDEEDAAERAESMSADEWISEGVQEDEYVCVEGVAKVSLRPKPKRRKARKG